MKQFGHQGWWPTTPAGAAAPVYVPKKPLTDLTELEQLEICLGAFLTQNTSWSNVERVLKLLSEEKALSFQALQKMRLSRMQRLFRSSGYFRQKSLRVRNFLNVVQHEAGGRFKRFFDRPLPGLRGRLLAMNGVGPETADSILLYAAGKPTFVVDAYTRRLGRHFRFLKGDESYDEIRSLFMNALPRSAAVYGEYHALIVKWGVEQRRRKQK